MTLTRAHVHTDAVLQVSCTCNDSLTCFISSSAQFPAASMSRIQTRLFKFNCVTKEEIHLFRDENGTKQGETTDIFMKLTGSVTSNSTPPVFHTYAVSDVHLRLNCNSKTFSKKLNASNLSA